MCLYSNTFTKNKDFFICNHSIVFKIGKCNINTALLFTVHIIIHSYIIIHSSHLNFANCSSSSDWNLAPYIAFSHHVSLVSFKLPFFFVFDLNFFKKTVQASYLLKSLLFSCKLLNYVSS